MRKDPNMMLRGSTWCLRIAVPKRLQAIRAEKGIRSSKEVWKTLGTGDYRAAKARMTQVKAEVCRGFEEEERHFLQRPVPTLPQLEEVARDFAQLVRTSLSNERLLELPTAPEVEEAMAARAEVAAVLEGPNASASITDVVIQYFNFDPVIFALEDQQEARQALRERLWAELLVMDYRSVDGFITEAARVRHCRIDPDSPAYRQLAHLLLKAWLGELDRNNDVFLRLDEPLRDQDEALAAWRNSKADVTIEANARETLPAMAAVIPTSRDIRQLFETYLREKFPKIAHNALLDRRRTIEQFVEVSGLHDVSAYRKVHVTAYKAALLGLPVNAGRDYPSKTMREVIELAPATAKRLAPKTVKSRLSILGSFGRWLSENVDGIDDANFRTTAPVTKKPESVVREFSDAEVCAILQCPAFTGCESERNQQAFGTYQIRDYRFWLPLMAAYTGCRLNELTQLRTDDVVQLDDIWALRITDAGEGQSLKTKASERLVPLHTALIHAGLPGFAESVRKEGHDDLFWDIPVGRNGRRSEAAGKWFRKLLVRIGVKTRAERGGLHRFRHSVVQKLRNQGHSDAEIALIVGHETRVAPMTAGYGSSRAGLLRQQRAILDSISYAGLSCHNHKPV